jgi:hypothetical protein
MSAITDLMAAYQDLALEVKKLSASFSGTETTELIARVIKEEEEEDVCKNCYAENCPIFIPDGMIYRIIKCHLWEAKKCG